MFGEILGGIVLYALLGTIANLVFATSITFMKTVMLENGGILRQFNFLVNDPANRSVLSILQGESTANVLLGVMWAAGWGLFGISAGIQIFKLIKNGSHNTSDAWIKTVIRLVVVATLLMNWFNILNAMLKLLSGLVGGALDTYGSVLLEHANSLGNVFSDASSAHIVGIEDIAQYPSDYILTVIVAFSLGTSLFSCTLAYLERFISMAIYCYVSPIAVGLAANEDSESTLKDWIMGLFPQALGLVACAALMVFGFSAVKDVAGQQTTKTVLQCAIATVFFSQARHVEEFFNMMGFKTMRATDAASSALAGAAMATSLARTSIGKIGKGIGKGVSGMAAGAPEGSFMNNMGKMFGSNNPKEAFAAAKDAGKQVKDKVGDVLTPAKVKSGGKPASPAPRSVMNDTTANRAAVASLAVARGSMKPSNGVSAVSQEKAQSSYESDLANNNIDVTGSNLESVQKPISGDDFVNAFYGAGLTNTDNVPVTDQELNAVRGSNDITATKNDDGSVDFHIPEHTNGKGKGAVTVPAVTMRASADVINGSAPPEQPAPTPTVDNSGAGSSGGGGVETPSTPSAAPTNDAAQRMNLNNVINGGDVQTFDGGADPDEIQTSTAGPSYTRINEALGNDNGDSANSRTQNKRITSPNPPQNPQAESQPVSKQGSNRRDAVPRNEYRENKKGGGNGRHSKIASPKKKKQ